MSCQGSFLTRVVPRLPCMQADPGLSASTPASAPPRNRIGFTKRTWPLGSKVRLCACIWGQHAHKRGALKYVQCCSCLCLCIDERAQMPLCSPIVPMLTRGFIVSALSDGFLLGQTMIACVHTRHTRHTHTYTHMRTHAYICKYI